MKSGKVNKRKAIRMIKVKVFIEMDVELDTDYAGYRGLTRNEVLNISMPGLAIDIEENLPKHKKAKITKMNYEHLIKGKVK